MVGMNSNVLDAGNCPILADCRIFGGGDIRLDGGCDTCATCDRCGIDSDLAGLIAEVSGDW